MVAKKTPFPADVSPESITIKVRPYPFKIDVITGEGIPPVKGSVLKLTNVGFLMQCDQANYFKVGENHRVRFLLPGLGYFFHEHVKVIKTYDTIGVAGKGLVKHYTVEMHFRALRDEKCQEILNFLRTIGQK